MASNQPWLANDVISIASFQHPLLKHPKKLLPKFDPNNGVLLEDHIKQFMLSQRLMNVEHENVSCSLFASFLIGKASTWFVSLAKRSITSWQQFEIAFITQFGDEKTSRVPFLEISRIKINKMEKIKYFNQRFISLLNQILDNPIEGVQIKFYIASLLPPVVMFEKSKEKQTLVEKFQEEIKVEKDLASISSHPSTKENKSSISEQDGKKRKWISKSESKDPTDIESMHRMIK
jgi:hypothetical protein